MNLELERDVMQVCLRGHVITDALVSHPEQGANHCDRCGAPTVCSCQTCGQGIPGAAPLPGMFTLGHRMAPQHCPGCGAAFPWAEDRVVAAMPDTLTALETLLRRLPLTVRQLRDRRDSRPTLKVDDVFDLEDLLRAVLPLQFDDVRRQSRTPSYCATVRTDFLVGPNRAAVTAKLLQARASEPQLVREACEDIAFYERQTECGGLVILIYDPEQFLFEPRHFEAALRGEDGLDVRCVVAT
jgi:REase_DpnII-MboI/Uncharacterized protein conserved in bacteria (DUF2321)